MLPDRVSNPGPLTYESGALPMNSSLTSLQKRGHSETEPRFEVSSERPKKRGMEWMEQS